MSARPTAGTPSRWPRLWRPSTWALRPLALADLVSELHWPSGLEVGMVELAGGPGSPLADDGDGADLVELLRPDVVLLVSGAGLGILSDVRLAAKALGAQPLIVYLNRYDPAQELHQRNRRGWQIVTAWW